MGYSRTRRWQTTATGRLSRSSTAETPTASPSTSSWTTGWGSYWLMAW